MPTPSVDPALAGYSPLLIEAVSSYPAGLDFVGDGLSPDELEILDWADSRLFANPSFLASKYGPDNWPSDVKLASVQAVPLLMLAIDIQKKSDGKHVINWEVDGLDRILDELGIHEGVCTSCYGKSFDARDEVSDDYYPIVDDPGHAARAPGTIQPSPSQAAHTESFSVNPRSHIGHSIMLSLLSGV